MAASFAVARSAIQALIAASNKKPVAAHRVKTEAYATTTRVFAISACVRRDTKARIVRFELTYARPTLARIRVYACPICRAPTIATVCHNSRALIVRLVFKYALQIRACTAFAQS